MADSEAERARRRRHHVAGDHSLCKIGGPCLEAGKPPVDDDEHDDTGLWQFTDEELADCGTTERAALRALSVFGYDEPDPLFAIAAMMVKLAREFDLAPTAMLASELRRNIQYLTAAKDRDENPLDRVRERVVRKTTRALLEAAKEPV